MILYLKWSLLLPKYVCHQNLSTNKNSFLKYSEQRSRRTNRFSQDRVQLQQRKCGGVWTAATVEGGEVFDRITCDTTTQNSKKFPSALASWCQTTTRPIAMDMGLTKEVDFPLHFTRSSFWHNFLNWLKYSGQSGRIYHKKSKNVSATK